MYVSLSVDNERKKKFLVVDLIITFRWGVFFGVKCDWAEDSGVLLGEDSGGDVV